jgi:hypothetical protein
MNIIDSGIVTGASFHINRRRFLHTVAAAAFSALPALGVDALEVANGMTWNVGLIGAGWYGPSDLW